MTLPFVLVLALVAVAQPAATKPAEQPKPGSGGTDKPADATKPDAAKPDPTKSADWPFTTAKAETVASGFKFTEGPAWTPAGGGMFVFCDMAGNKVMGWNMTGAPVPLRDPAGNCIGSAADKDGRIVQVETKGRRIIRWEIKDGKAGEPVEVAAMLDGKKLGGMNDLVVRKSDGSIYVSQGTWFLRGDDAKEKFFMGVIRIAPDGKVTGVSGGMKGPNGLCFSPDEKTLFVTEYGEGRIYACEVKADGTLGDRKLFADLSAMARQNGVSGQGSADGVRCDEKGNLYATGPGGIWVVSPAGKFVAMLPGRATNLAFGGPDGKTLLITTGSDVLKIGTKNKGL
ncbi:MAG: SMP-30/gluconolactonase/LRE family protein [Phycisphaerales bacterium]